MPFICVLVPGESVWFYLLQLCKRVNLLSIYSALVSRLGLWLAALAENLLEIQNLRLYSRPSESDTLPLAGAN